MISRIHSPSSVGLGRDVSWWNLPRNLWTNSTLGSSPRPEQIAAHWSRASKNAAEHAIQNVLPDLQSQSSRLGGLEVAKSSSNHPHFWGGPYLPHHPTSSHIIPPTVALSGDRCAVSSALLPCCANSKDKSSGAHGWQLAAGLFGGSWPINRENCENPR